MTITHLFLILNTVNAYARTYRGRKVFNNIDLLSVRRLVSRAARNLFLFPLFAILAYSAATPVFAAAPSAMVVNAGPGTIIELKPEESRTITFQFLNTDTVTWRASGTAPIRFRFKGYGNSFRHSSWISDIIPTRLSEREVRPGEIGTFTVTLQAPSALGKYALSPYLILGNTPIAHDTLELDAFVGYERPRAVPQPITPINEASSETPMGVIAGDATQLQLIQEPTMRIGLFVVQSPVTVTSGSAFSLTSGDTVLATAGAGTMVTLTPEGTSYSYLLPDGTQGTVAKPIRVRSENGIIDIPSLEQRASWNQALNDNRFRGVIELYRAENTGRYWLINELPMESYLKGLAETSQGAPFEYHKSLAVATRSYALYHWYAKNKHGGHFDLDATYDQVYRGYGIEQRLTDFGRAIDATRGVVAMIGNDVAVTPYFSQSDGRTRAWSEVWSGQKNHLQSVMVPWDQGKPLYGHGVGMSAMGAAAMAKEGNTWENILNYFYKGIELRNIYQ